MLYSRRPFSRLDVGYPNVSPVLNGGLYSQQINKAMQGAVEERIQELKKSRIPARNVAAYKRTLTRRARGGSDWAWEVWEDADGVVG